MGRLGKRNVTACALAAVMVVLAACSDDDESSSSSQAAATTEAPDETPTTAVATTAAEATTSAAPSTTETEPEETTTTAADTTVPQTDPPDTTPPVDEEEILAGVAEAMEGTPPGCDPLDTRHCLLPFPSNFHLRDGRVDFQVETMPQNVNGVAMDPTEWNRNDGFSPNTPILTYIEGLDAEASNLPPWTDLEASFASDASVVLVEIGVGENRVPLWAELDAKADADADRLLEIHPAVALTEGSTYMIGLQNLVGSDGEPIEPSAAFRAYRDGVITEVDELEALRDEMEDGFLALATTGVERGDLQLAWTFTVATEENIAGRMLHIRDDALAVLGDSAPSFTVTSVTPNSHDNIAFQVAGTFTVPNYLTFDGSPGNRFFHGEGVIPTADEMPIQNGELQAPFQCNVSIATTSGTEPAHLVQYGHGLLGSEREINAGNVRAFANEHNVVFCATKWAGMSEDDVGNAVATLEEMGQFPTMADRLQQGVLNQIFLGKWMIHPDGLATVPELIRPDGSSMIDTAHLDYDGNSQGGIMGFMLAAVSPDIERAVLGVVGQNYSMLLSRSVDFATYEAIFEPAYPNDLDRVLILALTQMLWDRGEGAGYIQHIVSDPYPDTAAKTMLLHVAFGDWQVSELTAMVAARTMGIPIHRPVTEDGRSQEVEPGWGLESITFPSDGSGLVIWDSGSDPIPFENLPPSTSRDPHEDPRADADVRRQKASFLFENTLIDVCDEAACLADPTD